MTFFVCLFCLSSDQYVTLPVLFLDLLSVAKEGNKQIGLYFKCGLRFDPINLANLFGNLTGESRFHGSSLLTAGIFEELVVGRTG